MFFWMIIRVALKSLIANKLRSILAMLGIIIGVGAVISMLAIGAGAQDRIMQQFAAFGTNLLTIHPGQLGSGGVMSGTRQDLKLEDAVALLKVPGVVGVAPVVGGNVQVKYMDHNTRTNLEGVSPNYFPMRNFPVDQGEYFTDLDCDHEARVAVIGPLTATNLFDDESPLGKTVKVNGINFRIVGVLKAKGDQGWYNPDDQICVPYTTAMKQLLGVDYVREIDVQIQSNDIVDQATRDVNAAIRQRHRLQPTDPDDVTIRSQAEFLEGAMRANATFTVLLGSVAAISLIVGGIGIMNIMLVTVTERTREIGIRKAIGAKQRDILQQFLLESVLISGIGGLLGVAFGVGGAQLIPRLSDMFTSIIQPMSIVISLGFSAAVGIFFGFYPAWRAAKLDPIEALRYE
ncbi:MAG TPA: ABC transporter permease [Tepidisphaeraceae bacterium]|jgi:putative ABC transport system permease protein